MDCCSSVHTQAFMLNKKIAIIVFIASLTPQFIWYKREAMKAETKTYFIWKFVTLDVTKHTRFSIALLRSS